MNGSFDVVETPGPVSNPFAFVTNGNKRFEVQELNVKHAALGTLTGGVVVGIEVNGKRMLIELDPSRKDFSKPNASRCSGFVNGATAEVDRDGITVNKDGKLVVFVI